MLEAGQLMIFFLFASTFLICRLLIYKLANKDYELANKDYGPANSGPEGIVDLVSGASCELPKLTEPSLSAQPSNRNFERCVMGTAAYSYR